MTEPAAIEATGLGDLALADAALIVIDVQNDWCDEKGAFAKAGNNAEVLRGPVPAICRLLDAVRQLPIPIIHVGTTHGRWTDSASALARFVRRGIDPDGFLQPGSWGAEFFQITPRPNEYVVIKHRWSAFAGTDLDQVLRARGIRTLVLCGVTTHVCVQNTAIHGVMGGYDVAVLTDCTGAFTPEQHTGSIDYMDALGVVITDAASLLPAWRRIVG